MNNNRDFISVDKRIVGYDGIIVILKERLKQYQTDADAAYEIGITPENLAQIKGGYQQPNTKVLEWLGYKKTVLYVPSNPTGDM